METGMTFADVNGTRLYYEVSGSGPPLVLIHGITLDTRMWDDQFEVFSENHQVIRYDVRGHGRSAQPGSEPYSNVDDLKALLDHLGIDKANVLGLSMGGGIALRFVLEHPEMVSTLLLADAALEGGVRSARAEAIFQEQLQAAAKNGVEAARTLWLEHPFFDAARERPDVAARHWIGGGRQQRPSYSVAERLGEITAPTLVIVGERDFEDFVTNAHRIASSIPDARLVIIPSVGHMSNLEHPATFNQAVLEFLG
jgi:pimeloyl-ACP methyl ester carboxylesterase